jgi:hypothetical protein
MKSIKQAFLAHKNELKEIAVDKLGISVYIGKWSGRERATVLSQMGGIEKLEDSKMYDEMIIGMAKILQITLKDDDGTRAFDDSDEDFNVIMNIDGEIIQDLFSAVMAYNGLAENAVVDAAKN